MATDRFPGYVRGTIRRTVARAANYQSFGFNDDRGRELGIITSVFRVEYRASDDERHYGSLIPEGKDGGFDYEGRTRTTRNGREYGAITRSVCGDTLEEVEEKLAKRVEEAQKRYAKKFAR